jgi:hypothetical protein
MVANQAEALYVMSLGDSALWSVRGLALGVLEEVMDADYVKNETIPNYARKDADGEYAVTCSFPVPPEGLMRESADGSVSFEQHVHIEWSGGQIDDFTTAHTYTFDEGQEKIKAETVQGTTSFRRKA